MIVYRISIPDDMAKMIHMDSTCVSCSDLSYVKLNYIFT